MNKSELIGKIAEKASLKKADAAAALDAFTEAIIDALKDGDKVNLVGFGSFSTGYRAARKGVNPATGKSVDIADKATVKFKAGKAFAETVDNKKLRDALKKAAKK